MPTTAGSTENPSERSYAGMVPQRESDDKRALLIHAWSQMAQQHWELALTDLDKKDHLGPAGLMAQRTAANMLALKQHRPDIYRQLFALFPIDMNNRHYRPVRSKSGALTIVVRTIEGDKLINPLDQPDAAAKRDVAKLAEPLKQDTPLLLCGISDGYFFQQLCLHPREHEGHRLAATYLVEPEPDLLLANFALHDFSAKDGPIQSTWVEWLVGPDWHDQFVTRLQEQWMLPVPGLVLGRKDLHEPIKQALHLVKAFRKQSAGQQREQALQHGVYTRRDELAKHLRAQGGRKPRVLIIGSRFGDEPADAADRAAQAFHTLGWETYHLTEKQDHHRLTPLPVWNALGSYKPDLVFSLGARWADRRDVIDPRIPVVRWLFQDDEQDTQHSTADMHGYNLRDFVLTQTNPITGGLSHVPARQVLPMPGVVTIQGNLHHTAASDPDLAKTDLLYIGGGAQDPRELLDKLVRRLHDPKLRQLAEIVGERMLADDQQGKAYPTAWHIDQLARELTPQVPHLKCSAKVYRQLANALFDPFNQALYRQQTLGWAADVADELGLTLAIHGKGWKQHPRFAKYAHAKPSTEERRNTLIAQAKINLHIAPSFVLDQKLMQGLAAGGFYLTRRHPADALLPEMVGFLDNYCTPTGKKAQQTPPAETVEEARAVVDPNHAKQLERLLERAQWITDQGRGLDPVACVRACQRAGLLDRHHVALPRLDQAEYDDPQQLKQRLERFLAAPDKRLDIVKKQRAALQHRLTFESALARAVTRIADLVETEE